MTRLTWTAAACLVVAAAGCNSTPAPIALTRKAEPKPTTRGVAQKPNWSASESDLASGLRYERSGNDRLAYQAYLQGVERDAKSSVLQHRLAAVCDRLGKFDEADSHYRAAIELVPRNADIYNDLGYSYFLRNQPIEGERALRHCLNLDPSHARAHTNLGLVLGCMGHEAESLAEFRRGGATDEQARASLTFVTKRHKTESMDSLVHTASHHEPIRPTSSRLPVLLRPQALAE